MNTISKEVHDAVAKSYGVFFESIAKLPKEKVAEDVLSIAKIHEHVQLLCKCINKTPEELKGLKILDVGSGFGIFVAVVNKYYGADAYGIEPAEVGFDTTFNICKDVLKELDVDIEKIKNAYGENIPFPANTFDIVFSSNTLEHTNNPEQVLREALRVLKPNGYLNFTFPNHYSYFDGHYAIFHPPLLSKNMLAWIVKNIYGRNPAFAYTIRTELNAVSIKKMLRKINNEYPHQLFSLGEETFMQRMTAINFSSWAGLIKIKRLLELAGKLKVNYLLAKLILLFKGWDPIIINLKKK